MDTDREGRGEPFRGSVPDVYNVDRVYAACRSAKLSSGQDVEHLYYISTQSGWFYLYPTVLNF
jgi:hypothetical protein